ncbi:hypothetical protein VF12_40200, partial [Nostoc linckia z15]
MQPNVTTPQTPFPWLKIFFGIMDYMKELGYDKVWIKDQINKTPSHIGPRARVLDGLMAKRGKINDADTLDVNEGEPFSLVEEGNAMKFVKTMFRQFLDYTFYEINDKPDTSKIRASISILNGKQAFVFIVIFIKPPILKLSISQTVEPTPLSTVDEEYVAYYLYRYQIPLLGFATLRWEKDIKGEPIRLYKASFLQFSDKPTPTEREFTTTQSIHRVYKPSKAENEQFIYYPTFQEVAEARKDPIQFQVVIDITMTKRNMIFGSFASLRQNDVMTPSAGWVLLIRGSESDYQNSKKLLHDHAAFIHDKQHENIV